MPFVENDDVVEALPPDRSDQTLAVWILPWRARSCDDFLDTHRLDAPDEIGAQDAVAIAQDVPWRIVVRPVPLHDGSRLDEDELTYIDGWG